MSVYYDCGDYLCLTCRNRDGASEVIWQCDGLQCACEEYVNFVTSKSVQDGKVIWREDMFATMMLVVLMWMRSMIIVMLMCRLYARHNRICFGLITTDVIAGKKHEPLLNV